MLVNTAALIGTPLVTFPLGFGYWWLAARRFPIESVGVASAAISAGALLAAVSALGFGTFLIGELPRQPGKAPVLVATALAIVGLVGFVLALGFALLAPTISRHLAPLAANLRTVILFAFGVALTTVALVLDQALIGMLRGRLFFWRNAVLAVLKLAALFAVASWTAWRSPMLIYATWTAGTLISVAFLVFIFVVGGSRPRTWRPDWRLMRSQKKVALWHHGVNLGLQAPVYALPILVTALLSPRKGAYFYAAWVIATVVFLVPQSLSTVLFAMSAAEPAALKSRIRQTVAHSVAVAFVALPLAFAAGPWILGLFGTTYESQASLSLRILILAAFPLIVRFHYIAVSRVFGMLRRAAITVAATSLLELMAAIAGGVVGGLVGLTIGWVGAVCLEALVMGPVVYRAMRGKTLGADQWQPVDPSAAPTSS